MMAEDLRKRLVFENTGVRNAAIQKLKRQIILGLAKSKKEGQEETLTKKIPELELLWEQCCVEAANVSHACCNALTSLVYTSNLYFDEVMRGFLNLVPSAKNVSGIGKGIVDLLEMQIRSTVKGKKVGLSTYTNPYKIRSPPHPFITCLMSRPDTWPVIQQQVQYLLRLRDKSIQPYVIPMLEPFLKYVFLEPSQSVQYACLRSTLYNTLLQQCLMDGDGTGSCKAIVTFFMECIPCLQIHNSQQLAEVITFIDQFATTLATVYPSSLPTQCIQLSTHVMALCHHAKQSGLDTSNLLIILQRLVQQIPLQELSMFLIGWLILEAWSSTELVILLEFVEWTVSADSLSKPISLLLIFPLLQIIASPPLSTTLHGDQLSWIRKKAIDCLSLIKSYQNDRKDYGPEIPYVHKAEYGISFCPSYINTITYTKLLCYLHGNKMAVLEWLAVIQYRLSLLHVVPDYILMILASLLMRREEDLFEKCLQSVLIVARIDPPKAPSVLALFLYMLSQEHRPHITMSILNAIPLAATHRYCITPVLKILQSLGTTKVMSAVSIRLLTALWKLQDRCFPHLLKMLTLENLKVRPNHPAEMDEILLAKAASIKDICEDRPFQHGADLVHLLTAIVNDCTSEHQAIAASMALQGLSALCEAEVVDIQSTWSILASKLQHDRRALVQMSVCKLFALVPSLVIDTEEYEEFQSYVVEMLWGLSSNKNTVVSGAAFRALARFDQEEFALYDLPEEVTVEARDRLAQMKQIQQPEEDQAEDGDDMDSIDVPGSCFLKLLLHINEEVVTDFQYFLESMLVQEVKNIPRSMYHPSQGTNKRSVSKMIATIPGLLHNKYTSNKQPGLKAGLSGGLLCCFESIPNVGREGRVERRHTASCGRAYQHMMTTLVNEVRIQPSEWFQSMHLPHIWEHFMDRTYIAVLEGRKAELEIQQSHGHRGDEEDDLATAQGIAWLWVRDKLTDVLKSCARGNPNAQGNSILALAALALVSSRHASSLGPEAIKNQTDAPEHMGQNYWLEMVGETMLCIVDNNYKPIRRVFTWCQRSSSKGIQSSSSPLSKSCAALALSILIPVLTTNHSDLIFKMLESLVSLLPGQHQADDTPIVLLHISLGLGLFLKKIYEERFTEVMDQESSLTIMKALVCLEELSLSDEGSKDVTGVHLGLALALGGMCHDGSTWARVHLSQMLGKLRAKLERGTDMDNSHQAMLMCVSCVTASLFASNLIHQDVAMEIAVTTEKLSVEYPKTSCAALSVGVLLHSLLQTDHSQISLNYNQAYSTWLEKLEDKTLDVQERLACISGLAALVSGPGTLVYGNSESTLMSDNESRTSNVVKKLSLLMNDNTDMTLQGESSWLLGYTYMVSVSATSTGISASTNYSQLPETSILRSCIDALIEAGKVGPEGFSPTKLEAVMQALKKPKTILPPLNWAGVLSPIKRLRFGSSVHLLCLQLALKECISSASAALFLAAAISPTLFASLQPPAKDLLYKSLPVLIKTVPIAKLKTFMATSLIDPFTRLGHSNRTTCEAVLEGLNNALAVPDPPQSVTFMLYQAVEKIYNLLPWDIKEYQVHQSVLVSQCVCQLPGEVIDRLTAPVAPGNLTKSTFIRAYIVAEGKQALVWLNPCIDVAMNCSKPDREHLIWYILGALTRCIAKKSEHTSVMTRMTWFLELMGHIHSVALNTANQVQNPTESVAFLFEVFGAAVAAWSSTSNITNMSIPMKWTSFSSSHGDSSINSGHHEDATIAAFVCQQLTNQIPVSLVTLLSMDPWNQISEKVVGWLLMLLEESCNCLKAELQFILRESVYSLRHTAAFNKLPTWSTAFILPKHTTASTIIDC